MPARPDLPGVCKAMRSSAHVEPAAAQGSPKQDLGASGRVSSLVGPSFVMMGDAAHSVKPNLGQGCNAALFDAQFFGQVQMHNILSLISTLHTSPSMQLSPNHAACCISLPRDLGSCCCLHLWRN